MALHATLGVVASVLAISAPLPALIVAAVAALSMALEAAGSPGCCGCCSRGARRRTC